MDSPYAFFLLILTGHVAATLFCEGHRATGPAPRIRRFKMILGGALAAVVFLVVGLQFPLVVVFSLPLIGGTRISEGYRDYRGNDPGGVKNMVFGVVLVSVAYLIGAMDMLPWNTEMGVLAIL